MSKEEYHSSNGSQNDSIRNGYYGGESNKRHLNDDNADDEIDLKQLLGVVLRYKWSIAAITFVSGVIAVWYAFSLLPIYESDGSLIIAESQNSYSMQGADLTNLISSQYGIGMGSTIGNELQVLQSRKLSEEVADKVIEEDVMENGQRFPILWRGFPEDSTVVSRDSVAMRIRGNMEIQQVEREAQLIRIRFNSFSPVEAQHLTNEVINTYTELSTEQNRVAANSALQFLDEELENVTGRLNQAEDELRNYMDGTRIVQIEQQTEAVIERITALESQRQEIRVTKVAVSSAVEQYQNQINQINQIRPGLAEQYAEGIGPTMERYQFQLAELETERQLILQRNPDLRDNPDQEPYLRDLNDKVELLREQINDLASSLIRDDGTEVYLGLLSSTGDGGIAGRLVELRGNLIELQIEESQLEAQETVVTERLEEENQFIDDLPDNMVAYARLRRDVEITEQLYLTISQQYAETALWEQTQFGLGRPLDTAYYPERPSQPNKRLILLIGLMLGGILGVGSAFGREMMNRTIDGAEKVRKVGYPLLAVIPDMTPYIKEKFSGRETVNVQGRSASTTWLNLLDSISPVAESYRRLHNNIIYSHPDQNFKTILITSTGKGEGKTTAAANLAVALSEAGKKILVVDSDLRRPAMNIVMGESRSPGIMEMIFDDAPMDEAIRETAAPGVFLLSAGRRPPNPSSVMQSKKLREAINKLKDQFDHILIDSAPYGIITDAAPMMRLADGVVLVTRFGLTQTHDLNQTIENLNRIRVNIIGTALVGYDHEKSADYYYSSNYKYDTYKAYEQYQETRD
ncbi:MAG: polysaccharide biosynthesis tyrosine autokinase [Balneolaceae bacterium]